MGILFKFYSHFVGAIEEDVVPVSTTAIDSGGPARIPPDFGEYFIPIVKLIHDKAQMTSKLIQNVML